MKKKGRVSIKFLTDKKQIIFLKNSKKLIKQKKIDHNEKKF